MESVTIYEHSPYTEKQLTKYLRILSDRLPEAIEVEQHEDGCVRLFDRLTGRHIGIPVDDVKFGEMFGADLGIDVLLEERAEYSNVIHPDMWRKR